MRSDGLPGGIWVPGCESCLVKRCGRSVGESRIGASQGVKGVKVSGGKLQKLVGSVISIRDKWAKEGDAAKIFRGA
jgi:hypothetical protein